MTSVNPSFGFCEGRRAGGGKFESICHQMFDWQIRLALKARGLSVLLHDSIELQKT
jgi:hypothetical protein